MKEMVTAISAGSGIEITHCPAIGRAVVTMGITSQAAVDDMFYALSQTLLTELHMTRRHILGLCLRAMIFKEDVE